MDLKKVSYQGRKFYRDPFGNNWNPGDTKTVTEEQARQLLRHPEFVQPGESTKKAKEAGTTQDAMAAMTDEEAKKAEADRAEQAERDRLAAVEKEEAEAKQRIQEQERAKKDEEQAQENMLLLVEGMDKSALEEYARKYEVELDKRLGVTKLRAQVATLIEQYGAR